MPYTLVATAARKNLVTVLTLALMLALGCGVYLLWPQPPSLYRDAVAQEAYLIGTIRTSVLTDPRFLKIPSSLGYPIPRIPGWLTFVLPPTLSVVLHSSDSAAGEGWTLLTDLGWRSRLTYLASGVLQKRLDGKISLIQDRGTLFATRDRLLLQNLTLSSRAPRVEMGSPLLPEALLTIDLSNKSQEITRWVERLQAGSQFLLFPSIGEIESVRVVIRHAAGDAVQGMVTIQAAQGGAIEMVRADADYLLDLLDRVMSAGDVSVEKTVRVRSGHVEMDVTVRHPERLSQIRWGTLREML